MHGLPPRIPGYVLHRRLGGGATSDVFAATDLVHRKSWAIKLLKKEAELDPTNQQLFEREAQIGLSLNHPNLVRFISADPHEPGLRHLVMEHLNGISLRRAIARRLLPATTTLHFMHQVAEAISHMHASGYVHGDIKPENIHLIGGRRAKLLDFGFAHQPGDNSELLEDGCVLGTANYIAPELCNDPPTDDFSNDVFGLGVMLYELLTGELPYEEGSTEETMILHRDETPASLREWTGTWPRDVVSLVDEMMTRRPSRRPDISEVADRLALLTISMVPQLV